MTKKNDDDDDTNFIFSFKFRLALDLAKERRYTKFQETDPFVIIWFTKDISLNSVRLNFCEDRHIFGKRFPVQINLNRNLFNGTISIADDSAVCFQVYSHLLDSDGQKSIRKCGFCNIIIKDIAQYFMANPQQFNVNIRESLLNNNNVKGHPRGTIEIEIFNPETANAIRSLKFHKSPINAFRHDFSERIIDSMRETNMVTEFFPLLDKRISVYKLPAYVFNKFVVPAEAFLMTEPTHNSEEFYLNILSFVMRQRYPIRLWNKTNAECVTFFENEPTIGWNERGAILCDIVATFPVSCPYAVDRVAVHSDKRKGFVLVPGEDFSRMLRLTKSGDCEDFQLEILLELGDILTYDKWKSKAMKLLQLTRAQYVACLCLKSVNQPSVGDTPHIGAEALDTFQYAAHDCVDLIPLKTFIKMCSTTKTKTKTTNENENENFEWLLKERKWALDTVTEPLQILIVEGTGRYAPEGGNPYKYAIARVKENLLKKDMHHKYLEKSQQRLIESRNEKSNYYNYNILALVWDSYVLHPGAVHQVFFLTESNDTKIGVCHDLYLKQTMDDKIKLYTVPPTSIDVLKYTYHVLKFDQPIPAMDAVVTDTSNWAEPLRKLLTANFPSIENENSLKSLEVLDLYYNFEDLNETVVIALNRLFQSEKPYIQYIDCLFFEVVKNVRVIVIRLFIKDFH